MKITGQLFIGFGRAGRATTFKAVNPATGEALEPAFSGADPSDVARACELAAAAFDAYRAVDIEKRAVFLDSIAERILALGDALPERANQESGLPLARLTGERGRTVGQLKFFAQELRSGRWQGVRLDSALPERKPLPRPDLRQRMIPIGPVAVFGASNFPLAFSTAGGDTASALAAGCPVIVKGHQAHPGTNELVASAIASAVEACCLPEGVFSMLNGVSNDVGAALVAHPAIKAVGFTGSRRGGLALMKIARERAEPIPVYAEMSSVNPVILFPGALDERAESLGKDFAGSLTLGVGQFCTNPGLLFAVDSAALERFVAAASAAIQEVVPSVMLTPAIHSAYERGVEKLRAQQQVSSLASGKAANGRHCGQAALFSIRAADVLANPSVIEEAFGPAALLVRCPDFDTLVRVLEHLEGQLTATLQITARDQALAASILPVLERKAGRLLVNGWPTGVEVADAMVHGGPFPATSDPRTTSVGTLAMERFLRPVCYQDFPDELLPPVLRRDQAV